MDRGPWWAYSPWGCKESDMTECLSTAWHSTSHTKKHHIALKLRVTSAIRRYMCCFRAGVGWAGEGLWGVIPRNWRMGRLQLGETQGRVFQQREQYAQRPHGGKAGRVWSTKSLWRWDVGGSGRLRPERLTEAGPHRTWWAGFRSLASPGATTLLAAAAGAGGTFPPPRAIFTSSVLASIFLWVRASRRTHGWTPRSWINGKQNAIQQPNLTPE